MRVIVVGAGLGGLALAQGLVASGIDVTVHERDPAPEARAQGARFHLDDRGRAALRDCLPAAGAELAEATLGQPSESLRVLGGPDLAVVAEKPFVGRPGRPDSVRPGSPASRQLVRRIFAHGLDGQVHHGSGLLGYERAGSAVVARFADGRVERGDVLVGADGIGSAVRRQRLPHASVADTGLRWLGGKTPITAEITATGLPERIAGSFSMTTVGELRMIVAAMRFAEPPAAAAARLLPGFAPGDDEDYLMWALIPRREQLGELDETFTDLPSERLLAHARSATAQAHPTLRLLVDQAMPTQAYGLAMGVSEEVDAWEPDAVTLLGDAVHAMTPNRGSGANTALQDAQRLRAALVAVERGERELVPAIGAYEEAMRRDGYEAVRASVAGMSEITEDAPAAGR